MTGHRRRSTNSGAFTVAELTARLRPDPEPKVSAAGPAGAALSVGELLQREGQAATVAARPQQARSRHATEPSPAEAPQATEPAPAQARLQQPRSRHATEPSQRTSRSLVLGAAVAGTALVYGSVFAGGLIGGPSDERDPESGEVFGPDGSRAGQHKAAIPTGSAQVLWQIPAARPQPSPITAGRSPVTGARAIIEPVPPSSSGSARSRPGAPGTWTPPPTRGAPDRPPPSSTTPSPPPATTPPPSDDPGDSGNGNSGNGNSGNGNSGNGNSGNGNSGNGNSGKGNSDKGNSDKGNSGKGNSGKGNSGKGNSDKGNSDKGNSDKGNSDNGG